MDLFIDFQMNFDFVTHESKFMVRNKNKMILCLDEPTMNLDSCVTKSKFI